MSNQILRPCSSRNGPKLSAGAMPAAHSGTELPSRFERNAVSRRKITAPPPASGAAAGFASRSRDSVDEVARVLRIHDRVGAFVWEPVAGDSQIGIGSDGLCEDAVESFEFAAAACRRRA